MTARHVSGIVFIFLSARCCHQYQISKHSILVDLVALIEAGILVLARNFIKADVTCGILLILHSATARTMVFILLQSAHKFQILHAICGPVCIQVEIFVE
jgi:hypothetical protein